jgi:hypothetical protein
MVIDVSNNRVGSVLHLGENLGNVDPLYAEKENDEAGKKPYRSYERCVSIWRSGYEEVAKNEVQDIGDGGERNAGSGVEGKNEW